jgi:hypothetical protein
VTTPPNDPTRPGDVPPYGLPPYGAPQDPQSAPPAGQYEGATNGFGGPFVPTPEQASPQLSKAPQFGAPPVNQEPPPSNGPYQTPYQSPYGPQGGQPPAGQPPYGQDPYAQNPYTAPQSNQNPYGQPPYGQSPYGQQPYGQNPYGSVGGQPYYPPPGAGMSNGLATAGMVLGIISIPFAIASFFDYPVVIVGFILSIIGLKRAKLSGIGAAKARAGIICTSIGAVCAILLSIYVVNEMRDCSGSSDFGTSSFNECLQSND